MTSYPLNKLSAVELSRRIRRGESTATDILNDHLAAIERLNPKLNAIITLETEQALKLAAKADRDAARGEFHGPLHGLPVVIKDITPTAGIRTTYGSPLFVDHVPDEDAEVVARLKRAGAIILGKTNTPEFAAGATTVNSLFGATLNPGTRN